MIIWINGAFGAGKTTTAYELHRRLPGSFVYDPENIGFFLRRNLPPSLTAGDFQDIQLWRGMNRDILGHIARGFDGIVIVPMTVCNPAYLMEVVGALRAEGIDVRHFLLEASRETLSKRLRSRGDGAGSWGAQQIERCLDGFGDPVFEGRIRTEGLSIGDVAERIAEAAGVALAPDDWGAIRRFAYRVGVRLRHIRV